MLKKIYLLLSFLLVFSCSCFASYEDKLLELETLRYGRTFQNESISQRLLRLEEDYFGLSQSGDITSRINMLSQIASNNYPNQLSYDRRVYQPQRKSSKLRNFLKDLASTFTDPGVMTGYIPPIQSYDDTYYNNSFNNDYYNRFFTPPKYSPNYAPSHVYTPHIPAPMISDYSPGYSNSNYYYDNWGNYRTDNRNLYSRSAVKILRD